MSEQNSYSQNCILCYKNSHFRSNNIQKSGQLNPSIILSCLKHIPQDIRQTVDWHGEHRNYYFRLCNICNENMKTLSTLDWELEEIQRKISELVNAITLHVRTERGKKPCPTLPVNVFGDYNSVDVNSIVEPQTEYSTLPKENKASAVYQVKNEENFADDFESLNSEPNDASQSDDEDVTAYDTNNKGYETSVNVPFPLPPKIQHVEQTQPKSSLQKLLDSTTGYECSTCHKKFSRYSVRQKHDCGKPTVECETCGCSFSNAGVLKLHIRSHTGEKPYKCETCGQAFSIRGNLTIHIQGQHSNDKSFECEICGMQFSYRVALSKHKLFKHETQTELYKCDVCGKNFKVLNALKSHLVTHSTGTTHPFKCDMCDKTFTLPKVLDVHKKRVHFGKGKAKCDICGKFVTKCNLRLHKMIHFGKPFQCIQCGKSYRTSSELKTHELTHKEEALFPCDVCGKSYKTPHLLRLHSQLHKDKITCEMCGKSVYPSSLKAHQQSHTNERRFKCDICDKRFTNKKGQIRHENHFCHICKIHFPRTSKVNTLTRHQVEVHTVNTILYPEVSLNTNDNKPIRKKIKQNIVTRKTDKRKSNKINYRESSSEQDETTSENSNDEDEMNDLKLKVEVKVEVEDEFLL